MPQVGYDHDSFIFSNMRVRRVEPDPATGALSIVAVYADREDQVIYYDGVLYSQMDHNTEGKRIVLTTEIDPESYRDAKHHISAVRFQQECGLVNLDSLEEMSRRGYRIFCHYTDERDEEYIVIAKKLQII